MKTIEEKEDILKELLGVKVIGAEIQRLLDSGRFPVTNHYDITRSILKKKGLSDELNSRGDVSFIFRNTVKEEEQVRQHFIGALIHEFTYSSDDILNEILTSDDPAIVEFYKKAKAITEEFWAYSYEL